MPQVHPTALAPKASCLHLINAVGPELALQMSTILFWQMKFTAALSRNVPLSA